MRKIFSAEKLSDAILVHGGEFPTTQSFEHRQHLKKEMKISHKISIKLPSL